MHFKPKCSDDVERNLYKNRHRHFGITSVDHNFTERIIILWLRPVKSSGLCSLILKTDSITRNDDLHKRLILDYSTKFKMSDSALVKLTKTVLAFPTDIVGLNGRMEGFQLLSEFFSRDSSLTLRLTILVNLCKKKKKILQKCLLLNPYFIAEFICAVNERVYLWLQECLVAVDI